MSSNKTIRLAIVLPGLHRVNRGAETAFEALGRELAKIPDTEVTLIGSGTERSGAPYNFIHAGCSPREKFRKWPSLPFLRNEYRYEELTFVPALWKVYDPSAYDAVITCSYPFAQWALRLKKTHGKRPAQIFVTENGDWPARRLNMEYKFFDCDGLVCTNPEYFERHRSTYPSALIPNGIDTDAFKPGEDQRKKLGLPDASPLFLMVSALIGSKYPVEGIRAVSEIPGAGLVIAGNGPLHEACDATGKELMGDRYQRITLPSDQMPALYRSADALLHMSRDEAFGNIYIEAAACGLPVVAHDHQNTRWILGEMGIFADTAAPEALQGALLNAVEQKQKLNSAERHRTLTGRYAWPVVAAQYHEFISGVLGP